MQVLKASCLSRTEAVSLQQLAAGAPQSSISAEHIDHFRKRMLIERHGPTWNLTPLGLQLLKGMPTSAPIASADPLALLESMVAKQRALQQHRGLVRERATRREAVYRAR